MNLLIKTYFDLIEAVLEGVVDEVEKLLIDINGSIFR